LSNCVHALSYAVFAPSTSLAPAIPSSRPTARLRHASPELAVQPDRYDAIALPGSFAVPLPCSYRSVAGAERIQDLVRALEHRRRRGRILRSADAGLDEVGAARAADATAHLARVLEALARTRVVTGAIRVIADVEAALEVVQAARFLEVPHRPLVVARDRAAARVQKAEQRARRAVTGGARLLEQRDAAHGVGVLAAALDVVVGLVVLLLRRQLRRRRLLHARSLRQTPDLTGRAFVVDRPGRRARECDEYEHGVACIHGSIPLRIQIGRSAD
jgi:hypothetical protein